MSLHTVILKHILLFSFVIFSYACCLPGALAHLETQLLPSSPGLSTGLVGAGAQ